MTSAGGTGKGLLNYTTKVSATRTIAEMQGTLAAAGAKRVMLEYLDGSPCALSFSLPTAHGERFYTLPCDAAAVLRILAGTDERLMKASKVKADAAQAERVAWRVLKDWLEAQLALVRTEMATLDMVMLPYLQVGGGDTLYSAWRENEDRALPAGGGAS